METTNKTAITVETTVNAPLEKAWEYFTEPRHITKWYQASEDWHAPYAENNLVAGGSFKTTMAAKDGSFSFDYGGIYTDVQPHKLMEFNLGDGRKVRVSFEREGKQTKVVETFEPEEKNSIEMQKGGWQAILDSFKKYTEAS